MEKFVAWNVEIARFIIRNITNSVRQRNKMRMNSSILLTSNACNIIFLLRLQKFRVQNYETFFLVNFVQVIGQS